MVLWEIGLKRYNVQRFECVGADTSRPKGNETELYRQTAQSRYTTERQIAAPYELRRFFRLPFNRQLRPITLRAANICPYGWAAPIHRAAVRTATLRVGRLPTPTGGGKNRENGTFGGKN